MSQNSGGSTVSGSGVGRQRPACRSAVRTSEGGVSSQSPSQ
ncbi:hypothetical protein ACFQX7_39425 [Luedemannella flava]